MAQYSLTLQNHGLKRHNHFISQFLTMKCIYINKIKRHNNKEQSPGCHDNHVSDTGEEEAFMVTLFLISSDMFIVT